MEAGQSPGPHINSRPKPLYLRLSARLRFPAAEGPVKGRIIKYG
jgi:hypothetical protein